MQSKSPHLSDSRLPAVYRPTIGWKIFLTLSSSVFVALPAMLLSAPSASGVGNTILIYGLSALFVLLAFWGLLFIFRWHVVLQDDRLEEVGLLKTNVLLRTDIRGWRIASSTLILERNDEAHSKMRIPLYFPLDVVFYQWLAHVPDLDASEASATTRDILSDEHFGRTRGERIVMMGRAKRKARIVNTIAGVVSAWGFLYPHPYTLLIVLLIVLPWVALAAVRQFQGLIHADEYKNDPHPSVATALIILPFALALRALFDFEILNTPSAFIWPAALAIIFATGVIVADPSVRKNKTTALIFIAFFGPVYGYGAAITLNSLIEKAPVAHYASVVQDHQIISGKSTTYELTLAPWGPKTMSNTVDVDSKTYNRIHTGQTVTISLRTGILGIRWYYVNAS